MGRLGADQLVAAYDIIFAFVLTFIRRYSLSDFSRSHPNIVGTSFRTFKLLEKNVASDVIELSVARNLPGRPEISNRYQFE